MSRGKELRDRIFTIRGYRKGKRAKAGKCQQCGEVIAIGEQYYYDSPFCYCLGCYSVNDNLISGNDDVYIPSTDQI